MDTDPEPLRIDKWLWVARLVKTRGLAAEAIKGGRVQLNGQRTKPSRDIQVGDRVEVSIGEVRRTVIVRGVLPTRRPAKEAELLYEETAESVAARERHAAERRLAAPIRTPGGARPTKRDRRRFDAEISARREAE